jgi:branched-subunit amino acid ABC-type transport system permease component
MVGGLAVGCVYSLIALGFAMIMRATNIIHFAQGEVMMLGCMCGLTSLWLLPVLPLLAVVAVGMASSGIIAVAMELAVYRTLRRRRVPIMNLITATVGMSMVMGVAIMAALQLFLKHTRTGLAMQAMAQDSEAAQLMGANLTRMMAYTFAISGMMAGAAGIMLGSMFFAFFEMGFITGLKGFVAATLGGLGSITGAMLGGILFGLIETFSTVFLSSAYKDGIGMILLIAILLVFPSGLVGLWQKRR